MRGNSFWCHIMHCRPLESRPRTSQCPLKLNCLISQFKTILKTVFHPSPTFHHKVTSLLEAFWIENARLCDTPPPLPPQKPIDCFITAELGNIISHSCCCADASWDSRQLRPIWRGRRGAEERRITQKMHRINRERLFKGQETLNSHFFNCSGGMSRRRHGTLDWALQEFESRAVDV